jgi:hypothetical protein
MISDDKREETWTFLDDQGRSVRVSVIVVDCPCQPGRSMFVSGVIADGRLVAVDNGDYICDDGSVLRLPIV